MKYTLTLILFLFFSCTNKTSDQVFDKDQTHEIFIGAEKSGGFNLTVEIYEIKIDGCEYLIVNRYRQFGITHKGDCINPIHIDK